MLNSCIEDVASQVLTVKKEERSILNARKPWERSTKARNIIRKALMALKVYINTLGHDICTANIVVNAITGWHRVVVR